MKRNVTLAVISLLALGTLGYSQSSQELNGDESLAKGNTAKAARKYIRAYKKTGDNSAAVKALDALAMLDRPHTASNLYRKAVHNGILLSDDDVSSYADNLIAIDRPHRARQAVMWLGGLDHPMIHDFASTQYTPGKPRYALTEREERGDVRLDKGKSKSGAKTYMREYENTGDDVLGRKAMNGIEKTDNPKKVIKLYDESKALGIRPTADAVHLYADALESRGLANQAEVALAGDLPGAITDEEELQAVIEKQLNDELARFIEANEDDWSMAQTDMTVRKREEAEARWVAQNYINKGQYGAAGTILEHAAKGMKSGDLAVDAGKVFCECGDSELIVEMYSLGEVWGAEKVCDECYTDALAALGRAVEAENRIDDCTQPDCGDQGLADGVLPGDDSWSDYEKFPDGQCTKRIYFDFDKYKLRPESKIRLDEVIKDFYELNTKATIVLDGHADARGSDAYNDPLSENRSEAAKYYLIANGIPESKIKVRYFGERLEVNNCVDGVYCTEPEHQLNRRVEIRLEPEE